MSDGTYLRNLIVSRCTEEGECLLWPGAMHAGYSPTLTYQGKNVQIRRWLWLNLGKKLPEKTAIKVKCKDRRCIAEVHLYAGKRGPEVGQQRTIAHRMRMAAVMRGRSNLTLDDVAEIRASELPLIEIAAQYGKSKRAIQRIRSGETWQPALGGIFSGLVA